MMSFVMASRDVVVAAALAWTGVGVDEAPGRDRACANPASCVEPIERERGGGARLGGGASVRLDCRLRW